MKILFLDIDGVLNSHRSAVAFGGYYPWGVEDKDLKLFDVVAVNLVRRLCKDTGATVVLSSTWRNGKDWEKIGPRLDIPIFDRTPIKIGGNRGHEIELWIERQYARSPELVSLGIKYAIIDDDSDMLEHQLPFFVQTSIKNGMMIEHYDRLVEILGKAA